MRFRVMHDSRARLPACHRPTRAPVRNRAAAQGTLGPGGLRTDADRVRQPERAGDGSVRHNDRQLRRRRRARPQRPASRPAPYLSCKSASLTPGALAGQTGGYLKFTNHSRTRAA